MNIRAGDKFKWSEEAKRTINSDYRNLTVVITADSIGLINGYYYPDHPRQTKINFSLNILKKMIERGDLKSQRLPTNKERLDEFSRQGTSS